MGLTVKAIMRELQKVGFPIIVDNPMRMIMTQGPSAMFCEASYNQGIDGLSGQYFEFIGFNPMFFRGIESTWTQRVLFHELAHSTGRHGRLERVSIDFRRRAEVSERMRFIEELIAERTAQKALTHFGIFERETRNGSMAYIETYLNGLDAKGMPLTEIEAYQIERDSDKALDYILQNWFNGIDAMQKQAA